MMRTSATWVRWIGWTVLYGVAGLGLTFISLFHRSSVTGLAMALGPPTAAFLIGKKFRSWWWILGPMTAVVVVASIVALFANARVGDDPYGGLAWFYYGLVMVGVIVGSLSAIAAAAGVWWGRSRASARAQASPQDLLPDEGSQGSASPAIDTAIPSGQEG